MQTEVASIRYAAVLHCGPTEDIRAGDRIYVQFGGVGIERRYTAGEPSPPYPSHLEVGLKRDEVA